MIALAFVDVSTVVGDDELGDGSLMRPVRTVARAEEIAAALGGAPLRVDGWVGDFPQAGRRTDWQYVACWVVLLAFVAAVIAAIVGKAVGL